MKGKLSEIDKLHLKAQRLLNKIKWHSEQIDTLQAEISKIQDEANDLAKPGFKIPKKKKTIFD